MIFCTALTITMLSNLSFPSSGSHSLEAGESGLDDESQDIAGGAIAIIIYPNIFSLSNLI